MKDWFAGLRDRDYRREGLFVLEGSFNIEKALARGVEPVSLLCFPSEVDRWRSLVPSSCEVFSLPAREIETLVGYPFHRGALALARRPSLDSLESGAVLPAGPLLALWQVSDPDNLGALSRSAAALGASGIILGPGCADPYSRKALRASMACLLALPLFEVESFDMLKQALGVERPLVAAALCDDALLPEAIAGVDPCLLLGNEGFGLPQDVMESCAFRVMLPMHNTVDSLNVGAAGAILMWELFAKKDRA